jgi:3-methyladenine DNA glycosylase AlkC
VPGFLARPRATLPINDALHRDPREYVRRSVGDRLDDFGPRHPGIVVETARSWLSRPDENTARVVARGLRGAARRGDPEATAT